MGKHESAHVRSCRGKGAKQHTMYQSGTLSKQWPPGAAVVCPGFCQAQAVDTACAGLFLLTYTQNYGSGTKSDTHHAALLLIGWCHLVEQGVILSGLLRTLELETRATDRQNVITSGRLQYNNRQGYDAKVSQRYNRLSQCCLRWCQQHKRPSTGGALRLKITATVCLSGRSQGSGNGSSGCVPLSSSSLRLGPWLRPLLDQTPGWQGRRRTDHVP